MHTKATIYEKNARTTANGRELEAMVLLRAALRMRQARDALQQGNNTLLDEALAHNKKLWIVLISELDEDENPLPKEIRQNLISLGAFALKQTINIIHDPKPEKIDILIQINENIANGLNGRVE